MVNPDKMMIPVSLSRLKKDNKIKFTSTGMVFRSKKKWVIKDETRLSYTTLTKLIECCREYHWEKDIQSSFKNHNIDTTCKSFSAQFYKPVSYHSLLSIDYSIVNINKKDYEIKFVICDLYKNIVCSEFLMVQVFIDLSDFRSIAIPSDIHNLLSRLKKTAGP
ncbi:MAG: hypothetical protein PWQ55_1231 [Chloroflexota bacterium]|nr:hypothetical protein [Chloroflexota bacterium]